MQFDRNSRAQFFFFFLSAFVLSLWAFDLIGEAACENLKSDL